VALIPASLFFSSAICPDAEMCRQTTTSSMLRIDDTYFRFFIEASYWLGWSVVKVELSPDFLKRDLERGDLRLARY
jgi:hypothetical protein